MWVSFLTMTKNFLREINAVLFHVSCRFIAVPSIRWHETCTVRRYGRITYPDMTKIAQMVRLVELFGYIARCKDGKKVTVE